LSETVRAFLAVELSDAARAAVLEAVEALRRVAHGPIRWVPAENLHLTLKFLGHLPEETLSRLLRALLPRLAKIEPFRFELSGVGAFPSARAARVLWVGVAEGGSELARLARSVEGAAARAGVARERRPFQGHLTIARLREPGRVPIERVAGPDRVAVEVREVVLFRSDLRREGARYVPIARLPLGEACEAQVESLHPEG
jgi:2'-5' RNA ligase